MNNTQHAKELFDIIKSSPIPGVEKRMNHKRGEIKKFLIEQNCLDEANDSELIHDIACFSEVGYSMRQQISKPLVTAIQLDNGNRYDFSITPFNLISDPFPYDLICIRRDREEDKDIVFIFDIAILIGGCINDIKVEYKGERYYV